MRIPRALLGSLLWILAAVLGLVAVILCVTVILLPLGIEKIHLRVHQSRAHQNCTLHKRIPT